MVTLRQTPPRIRKRLQLQEFYCRNAFLQLSCKNRGTLILPQNTCNFFQLLAQKNRQTLFGTLIVFKQKLMNTKIFQKNTLL